MAEEKQDVFKAVISAVDDASKTIEDIKNKVRGLTQAEEKSAAEPHNHGLMHHLTALRGHVTFLRGQFGELGASIGEASGSLAEFVPALGALGAAGGLVGLFEMTNQVAEARGELQKAADEIGILPARLQELNYAAKLTDVSIEGMHGGLEKLDKAIATAAAGKNKDALGLFRHLGISLKDSQGHLRSTADMLPQLADAFQRTTDPALRVRMAMALFGKAGVEMIPMLLDGAEGLSKLSDEARRFQFAPSKEQGEDLLHFHEAMLQIGAAVGGLKDEIGTELAPVLTPVISQMADWIAANRDWIAGAITQRVSELADVVKAIIPHLQEVPGMVRGWIEPFIAIGRAVGALVSHVGGTTTAIGGLMLVFGSPLAAGVAALVAAMGVIAETVTATGALMLANPIVAGITGIAVAAALIYKYWDPIKAFFAELIDGITDSWRRLLDFFGVTQAQIGHLFGAAVLTPLFAPFIAVADEIIAGWRPVMDFFKTLGGDLSGFAHRLDGMMPSWMKRLAPGANTGAEASSPTESPASPLPGPYAAAAAPGAPGTAGNPGPGSVGAASAPAPASGRVDVHVRMENAPPGTQLRATSTGDIGTTSSSVGWAMPMLAPTVGY